VAGRASTPRLAHAAEAPDVTGCRGISCSEHFLVQLAVVRMPPPPSGMGATARYHRSSPQGAELTARDITFSWLRRRGGGVLITACGGIHGVIGGNAVLVLCSSPDSATHTLGARGTFGYFWCAAFCGPLAAAVFFYINNQGPALKRSGRPRAPR
jgi:hypothetical protein